MIREECGQIAHQTLPNIQLSNASLVTKSCIARFVDDDAFNPSALSDCSTGPSPQLAWRTESRPCRHPRPTPAVHSPAYLPAFARFPNKRLIAVGKFERNVRDHLSTFLKLRFHVLRCSRNDTFFRAFEIFCRFFLAFARRLNVRDCTPHRLLMRRCWWLTGQVGPAPPPLRGRPHRLTAAQWGFFRFSLN